MKHTFTRTVTSAAGLEALIGTPSELALKKQLAKLDRHMVAFIGNSRFLLVATIGRDGRCDVSPRGDAPGFVRVLDDETLILPERSGHRRVDSLHNTLIPDASD